MLVLKYSDLFIDRWVQLEFWKVPRVVAWLMAGWVSLIKLQLSGAADFVSFSTFFVSISTFLLSKFPRYLSKLPRSFSKSACDSYI